MDNISLYLVYSPIAPIHKMRLESTHRYNWYIVICGIAISGLHCIIHLLNLIILPFKNSSKKVTSVSTINSSLNTKGKPVHRTWGHALYRTWRHASELFLLLHWYNSLYPFAGWVHSQLQNAQVLTFAPKVFTHASCTVIRSWDVSGAWIQTQYFVPEVPYPRF